MKIFIKKTVILVSAIFFINIGNLSLAGEEKPQKDNPRGIWVTAFSDRKVLYSKGAAKDLIEFCKEMGINEIYLQLYRGGIAYYDSSIGPNEKYKEMLKSAGIDTIDFLLGEASKNNVGVFAWLNILSIGQNREADILKRFGDSVLTRDQYLRPSIKTENKNETDRYYLRDGQLFLEPADPRVREYILSIINEILTRYPALNGVHLDYIRYPHAIPFLPDSRFIKYGISYGYGQKGIEGFKEKTGLDPLAIKDDKYDCLVWDSWKRKQVTSLVQDISRHVKNKSKDMFVSCAVIPSSERAYLVAFQDWPAWLEEGLVDYVILMNYTIDNKLAKETVKSALSHRGKGKVYTGIGVFLMKDNLQLLSEQYKTIADLKPDGIAFFSYDNLIDRPVRDTIKKF